MFVIYPVIKYRKETKIKKVPFEILRVLAAILILGIYLNAYDIYKNLGETFFFYEMLISWLLIIFNLSILIKYRNQLNLYELK